MRTQDTPPLDRWRFDGIFTPPKILAGAKVIADRINTSPDFVRRTLINRPGSPVKKVGGRYFAVESELIDYFRPDTNTHDRAQ